MKQHRWHKEIKAWADGAEIECCTCSVNGKDLWTNCLFPTWEIDDDYAYRIKPQPKEDIIKMTCCFCGQVISYNTYHACTTEHNIKPQPKEPQYLYVFADLADWEATRTSVLNRKKDYETYIGKIKLEEEQ